MNEWQDRLPLLVAECATSWNLVLGERLGGDTEAFVIAVTCRGRPCVLKLNPPDPESELEADALRCYAGLGAARLIESDRQRGALLLERLTPGGSLWTVADEADADAVAAAVLAELWLAQPAVGFRPLADAAAEWAALLPPLWRSLGRPFPRRLLDLALAAARELPASPQHSVLLHQDLHGGNILRDGDGWRAIDPKPLVGDAAFDLASLLRDRRPELAVDPDPAGRVRRRFRRLTALTGVDRERARGWGVLHALAWGVDTDGADPVMVACAEWIAAA